MQTWLIVGYYRPGRTVKVHYDPKRPHIAVLRPDRVTSLRPVLVIGPAAVMYVLFIVSPLFVGLTRRCRASFSRFLKYPPAP